MRAVARKRGEVVAETELQGDILYLGRSKKNDLPLDDPDVSRRHARILRKGDGFQLEDLKSINGTKFQGRRIDYAEVFVGDEFQIGPFWIKLEASSQRVPTSTEERTLAEAPPTVPPSSQIEAEVSEPDLSQESVVSEISPSPGAKDDFMEAIAVRPAARSAAPSDDELPVLASFLEKEEGEGGEGGGDEGIEEEPLESTEARLVRLDGEHAGESIPIDKDHVTFSGRGDADVAVDTVEEEGEEEDSVSILKEGEETFLLRNPHSSPLEALVDGVPVRERELENHDVIQVGKSRFEFVQGATRSASDPPRVIERVRQRSKRRFPRFLGLILAGVLIGLSIIVFWSNEQTGQKEKVISTPKVESEQTRLVRYHLFEAEKLLTQKDFKGSEAKIQMVLDSIAPDHPEAVKLLARITKQRNLEARRIEAGKRAHAQREKKIEELLAKGDALVAKKKFSQARDYYKKALALDSSRSKSSAALSNLSVKEEEEKRRTIAQKKTAAQMKKIYQEGVKRYELSDYGEAKRLLEVVAARKGHPYRKSARKLLASISNLTDDKVDERIKKLKAMTKKTSKLPKAYAEIKKISKQFPRHKGVAKALSLARRRMNEQARKLYREGLALEELAEDPAAALDKYKESLRFQPNPKGEYHQRAMKRIRSLQLSP